ncbi:MAG: 16S rRNA (guanine(966)-N(2))-methyltransferase RsmD [Bacillales bacterium]|nr:16S rRNA (guanine(966)-N(2))-methyltransferase RsmD [Bacillales bacterium]
MLRIIGGKYRHLQIKAPDSDLTRPTTDKVREAIMSALSNDLYNAKVLDLFSGSGALGLEALSRGARSATFVDKNSLAIKTIKENIEYMHVKEEVEICLSSYKSFLASHKNEQYDVVFLDPPYKMKEVYDEIVDFLFENNMISSNGVIVKECDTPFYEDDRFIKYKNYKYGIIYVTIYWR